MSRCLVAAIGMAVVVVAVVVSGQDGKPGGIANLAVTLAVIRGISADRAARLVDLARVVVGSV
jgi:hypothetical protein